MMADDVTGQAGVVVPQAVAQLGYQQLEARKRIAMQMLIMQRARAIIAAKKAAQVQQVPEVPDPQAELEAQQQQRMLADAQGGA